jgi:HEAT repeat protein
MTSTSNHLLRRTRFPRCGIASLTAAFASRDRMQRENARQRILAIGAPAVPALIKCLSHPSRLVRGEAAKTLGQIKDPSAGPALVGALEDDDRDIRRLAAAGLVGLGHKGLAPLLSALIERPGSLWLRQGAHHVCHDLARTEAAALVRPVLAALSTSAPQRTVPPAAHAALHALSQLC